MYCDVGTYGGNRQSIACHTHDYSGWADYILCGWQRDIEQQQPGQQRLDARRRDNRFDFSDHERHVFRSREQWWLCFGSFECHHGHRESIAFYAYDYTIRPHDLLYGWQRQLDFDCCE
jgi:hypothetical protein